MSFESLRRFNDLLLAYQRIERVVWVPGTTRNENDVEHRYMLTMLAWYLVRKDKLSLNLDLILRYALVHDLVEVYAGDTYIYDPTAVATKHEREAKAGERLKREYPEFDDLHETIVAYEQQEDAESRFVRALDKVMPLLVGYTDGWRRWREEKVTLQMAVDAKQEIINRSPEVRPYFDALVEELKGHPEFFKEE